MALSAMDSELKYPHSLLFKLNSLQKESVLCDVELSVCGQVFQAHRVMLSAASPYFHVMFCGGMIETFHRQVRLQGVSSSTFAVLLNFIYSGKISITSSNVQELLSAAKMFQLDDVERDCCEFLSKELIPSNCLGIFLFADAHSCKNLYETVLNYIHRNFKDVSQNEEFLELDKSTLLMLIKSEEIKINNEEDVFVSVMSWILHDVSKRCKFIGQLLEHIRLPLLSSMCVQQHVETCPNASVKQMVQTLYQEYLKFQLMSDNTIYRCPRTYSQKHFYIIGGYTRKPDARWTETVSLANVEVYDKLIITNSQTYSISPMNYPRSSLGVAALNGLVYAIGGEKDSLIYDSLERYNPVLNQWNLMASMKTSRVGLGACVVGDEIYVVGGWIGSEIAKTIEKYNPHDDCWSVVGNVATPRYHAGVCEMNGLIYVVGGMDEIGEDLQTGEFYDPVREKWSSIVPMKHKRSCVAAVSLGGCIYAIGGCNAYEGGLDSIEIYNVKSNSWEEGEPMPSVCVSACAAAFQNCIYVFGGRTVDYPPEILDTVHCYNTGNKTWISAGKLNLKRSEAGVVIV